MRALEEADNFAVFVGIRGHPVPGFWREVWCVLFNDSMETLGYGTIGEGHLGDLCEHGLFPVRLVRPNLSDTFLHRGAFLIGEPLDTLVFSDACHSLFTPFHFYFTLS